MRCLVVRQLAANLFIDIINEMDLNQTKIKISIPANLSLFPLADSASEASSVFELECVYVSCASFVRLINSQQSCSKMNCQFFLENNSSFARKALGLVNLQLL